MFKHSNGKPLEIGDVVRVKKKSYYVESMHCKLGVITVMIVSMCEKKERKQVFPANIGIHWEHGKPLFNNVLTPI